MYHECVAILRSELGVEPSPATRQVYAADPRGRRHLHIVVADHRSGSRGAGRRVDCGHPIAGQTPSTASPTSSSSRANQVVGKTRLAEEAIGRRGVSTEVLWSAERGAYPSEGTWATASCSRGCARRSWPKRWRRLPASEVAELARLPPELPARRGQTPSGSSDGADRLRLFGSVVDALTATGACRYCSSSTTRTGATRRACSCSTTSCASRRRARSWSSPPSGPRISTPSTRWWRSPAGLQLIDRVTEVALERLTRCGTIEAGSAPDRPTASTSPPSMPCTRTPRATRCSSSRRSGPVSTAWPADEGSVPSCTP